MTIRDMILRRALQHRMGARMGLGLSGPAGKTGPAPPPPSATLALTSIADGDVLFANVAQTISGTCTGCDSVEVFWELVPGVSGPVSLGTDASVGGGTFSIAKTFVDTYGASECAFAGEITAVGAKTEGGTIDATPVTVDVYSPVLETGGGGYTGLVALVDLIHQGAHMTLDGSNFVTAGINKMSGGAIGNSDAGRMTWNADQFGTGRGGVSTSAARLSNAADLPSVNAFDGATPRGRIWIHHAPTASDPASGQTILSWSTNAATTNRNAVQILSSGTGAYGVDRRNSAGTANGLWDPLNTRDTDPHILEVRIPGDGTTMHFRIDGEPEVSETIAGDYTIDANRWALGGASWSAAQFFSGKFGMIAWGDVDDAAAERIRAYISAVSGVAVALADIDGMSVLANDAYGFTSSNVMPYRTAVWSYTEGATQKQVACYTDSQDRFRLAVRDYGSNTWTLVSKIPFTDIGSADNHNVCVVAVDGSGYFHCWASGHNVPMRYCRSTAPYDPETLPELGTGSADFEPGATDEDDVTYVEANIFSNGDLLVMYRDGGSGNGDTHLKRYDHVTQTVTKLCMLIRGTIDSCNAYTNEIHIDVNDRVHVAWTWRLTPALSSNEQDICYCVSEPDPVDASAEWFADPVSATPLTLPIRRTVSPPTIASIAADSGLCAIGGMATDASGNPAVATYRCMTPGGSGAASHDSQYFALFWNGAGWTERIIGGLTTDFHRGNSTLTGPFLGWCKMLWRSSDDTWHVLTGTYPDLDGVYVNSAPDSDTTAWSGWTAIYPYSEGNYGSNGEVKRANVIYDRPRWRNHGVLSLFLQNGIQCGVYEATLP